MSRTVPYENVTSGERALTEAQDILRGFGCDSIGVMTTEAEQTIYLQFTWRERRVSMKASWGGYAAMYARMKRPRTGWKRGQQESAIARGQKIGRMAVCSMLRDWVKGQITAIECGVMTFDVAFLSHLMLPSGETVSQHVMDTAKLLPARSEAA